MNDEPEDKAKSSDGESRQDSRPEPLVEGIDYYLENGLFVFTARFLKKRGYCCESGCRHCPYGFKLPT